ncbi:MAG: cytochrome c3 family protein [Candidatus Methylomirabilales bacterium]
MIPSHMFQVRVQCVACHIVPKEKKRVAGIVGQTFRPSEQACLGCHGEKYRGMLKRWSDTLRKMQEAVAPKLAAMDKALASANPKNPKHAKARKLVDDAAFNTHFVALAKGVHNVFYAADLLKLANGWLDEAFTLLGQAPVETDDVLVRGRYCRELCHQQAGVPLPVTVTFKGQEVPHGRHITEFGAVCTDCHSAEVHKAVTATPATCVSCHHSPENERCTSCHRTQAAFYRGEIKTDLAKIEPNVMAAAVDCTGCHDWNKKHSRKAVGQQCLACHDEAYVAFLDEWTTGLDEQMAKATKDLKRAEVALKKARRAKRKISAAESLVEDAHRALAVVKGGRGVHNPAAADALLEVVRQKAKQALAQIGRR